MLKVRHYRSDYNAKLMLVKPNFDWIGLYPRFFNMVYEAMLPDVQINPVHLSSSATHIMGEIYARYNLGGGPSSLTLRPDRLEFEFRNVLASDVPVTYDFMRRMHDAFGKTFPELKYDRVETYSLEHDEVLPPGDVDKYLDLFKRPIRGAFTDLGDFNEEPSGLIHATAKDQSWACRLRMERSLLIPNGIFCEYSMNMNKQGSETSFDEKLAFALKLSKACFEALGLEGTKA